MAKNTKTYRPSAEIEELVRRFLGGDTNEEIRAILKQLYASDAGFKRYFDGMRRAQKSFTVNRGESWSAGTGGARRNGSETTNLIGAFPTELDNNLRQRNSSYGSNKVSSPGGFKASGRDSMSVLRRSGTMSGEYAKNAVKVDFDKGTATFNGQKYSKSQLNAILKRGMSGATMNWKDQAIYDRIVPYGVNMDEAKQARMDEMRQSAIDRDALKQEEERRRQEADAADVLKRDRDFEDWKRQKDYEARLKDRETWKKEATYEYLNEKHGLPKGTRLSQKDYDALESGAKVYDHDADIKAKYERGRKEIEDKFFNKEIDEAAYKYALDALEEEYANSPMRLVDNSAPKTVEQILAGAQNGLYVNGNGDLVAVPDTFENKQNQRSKEARQKRQDRLDDIAETRRLERNKWVAEQTLKQQAAHEKARAAAEKEFTADPYNEGKEFTYPDFDELAMRKRLFDLYDATERGAETPDPGDGGEVVVPQQAEEPAELPQKTGWRNYLEARDAAMETPQSDDEVIPGGICPICGAQLDEFGNCNVCGYPDEKAVTSWKLENGIE